MTVSTIKMTARQFLELGEDPPGVRLELVDGEVAVSPSLTPLHSHIVAELTALLLVHVKRRKLGRIFNDVDTIFGDNDIRRPDILYFSKSRLALVGEKAMEGPPDLCVEVVSPGSAQIDRRAKFKQYAKAGVEHYWIVDPKLRTVEAFQLIGRKFKPTGDAKGNQVAQLLPFQDLKIPLADLWSFLD